MTVKKEESDELDSVEPPKKPKKEDGGIIRKQNEEIFRYRDQLKALPKKNLQTLLEYNDQHVPAGTESVITGSLNLIPSLIDSLNAYSFPDARSIG